MSDQRSQQEWENSSGTGNLEDSSTSSRDSFHCLPARLGPPPRSSLAYIQEVEGIAEPEKS